MQRYEINKDYLDSALKEVREKYSVELMRFIKILLTIDENERPNAEDLFYEIEELYKKGMHISEKIQVF